MKISGGSARLGQTIILLLFLPIIIAVSYGVLLKNSTTGGLIFLSFLLLVMIIILRNIFSFGDLYLDGKTITIKKLFNKKDKHKNDIVEIDKGLMPFTFYIEFKDSYRVYFLTEAIDILKQVVSSDPDRNLNTLKSKLDSVRP